MEGNTPFRLWKCDKCDVELDEVDGNIPNKMGDLEVCDCCYLPPWSKKAVRQGCTCKHGSSGVWVISPNCPLHSTKHQRIIMGVEIP